MKFKIINLKPMLMVMVLPLLLVIKKNPLAKQQAQMESMFLQISIMTSVKVVIKKHILKTKDSSSIITIKLTEEGKQILTHKLKVWVILSVLVEVTMMEVSMK